MGGLTLRRRMWIAFGCVLTIAGFTAYLLVRESQIPGDIEIQGQSGAVTERLALIGLATGVVGLLTALVGLAKEVIALRKR